MWRGGTSLAHFRDAWRRSCRSSSWQARLLSPPSSPEVTIVEVGPRDGLQNEKTTPLTVDQRVQLVQLLARAGCPKIEVGSFVSPKWVPAMANSDQVYERLSDSLTGPTTFSCLVPNTKGMLDAQRVKVDEIAIFAAASQSFSQKVRFVLRFISKLFDVHNFLVNITASHFSLLHLNDSTLEHQLLD